jgi:hypothetical protein
VPLAWSWCWMCGEFESLVRSRHGRSAASAISVMAAISAAVASSDRAPHHVHADTSLSYVPAPNVLVAAAVAVVFVAAAMGIVVVASVVVAAVSVAWSRALSHSVIVGLVDSMSLRLWKANELQV